MYRHIATTWGYTYDEIANMSPLQQLSLISNAGDKTITFKNEADRRRALTGQRAG